MAIKIPQYCFSRAGVIRPTSGSILLRISGPEKLAWVSQMTTMDWYLTAFHNVRLGARLGI